ncbi:MULTISPECIES: hypothetical protein [unclassified Oceanispirochaeta]|uniref:hypothetical protein n=1 Tax=unclassified Oceanispirochaeta TaxID=2635722 RepID=UPI000E08D313|nr:MULTISPECIES: hypothetical protein [unclassified Oceanispirochaeta]MBF9018623.1 hypothetical protein [Oceanispirochaeta sp. M2]NPD75060.1 hypothetical protein [Oceanispirochaeta sp. M1]RDG29086.1 hypothetical protein DV872_23470 [Oceanispirochaeta sp. M1]
MYLNDKTIEKLRNLINEETEYRSGPKLVEFFNTLGFNDYYGQGFPSRWMYTDEKLKALNGTPELDKCIRKLLAPQNFIGHYEDLDVFISEFNQYLAYDNWKVIRNGKEISFTKAEDIDFSYSVEDTDSDNFLEREFNDISLDKLGLDSSITNVLSLRLEEIKKCISSGAPLSVIFLSGSTLEGILLGFALKHPKEFNQSKCAPNIEGKVKNFPEWTLANFIDVAYDIKIIQEDVKKYSHSLRDFRNYIHPYMQMNSQFNPSVQTAKISFHVLKAAIHELIRS